MNNANEGNRMKGKKRERKERGGKRAMMMLSGTWWRKYFRNLSCVDTMGFYCTRAERPAPPTRWRAGVLPSRASCYLLMLNADDWRFAPSTSPLHGIPQYPSTSRPLVHTYKYTRSRQSVPRIQLTAGMNIQCETPSILYFNKKRVRDFALRDVFFVRKLPSGKTTRV